MKAATVRVNDVEGVGGFVLPGDRVDVMMTRHAEKTAGSTDIVLQNVKVLAVDQIADDSVDKPAVVKAVTLEVDSVGGKNCRLRPRWQPVAGAAQGRRGRGRCHAPRDDQRSRQSRDRGACAGDQTLFDHHGHDARRAEDRVQRADRERQLARGVGATRR